VKIDVLKVKNGFFRKSVHDLIRIAMNNLIRKHQNIILYIKKFENFYCLHCANAIYIEYFNYLLHRSCYYYH